MLQPYGCHLVLANKMIESRMVSEYVSWGGAPPSPPLTRYGPEMGYEMHT